MCSRRNPKECKFWLGDPRGCLRGQICKYLHRAESLRKNIKNRVIIEEKAKGRNNTDSSANGIKNDSSGKDLTRSNTRHVMEKDDEQNPKNKEAMVIDVEDVQTSKDDIITTLRINTRSLENDNRVLKEQLARLNRVVINMNEHIKGKQN